MFPPHMPVRARDVVSLTLKHGTVRNRYPRRADVDAALERVGAGPLADARVGTLSGGHQQLVRQAQAFGNNPELVLADEPLLSLDASRQRETVRRLADSDAAVMMVTHTIDPVMPVVDKVLYLGRTGTSSARRRRCCAPMCSASSTARVSTSLPCAERR